MKTKSTLLATVFGAALVVSGAALADEVGCYYNESWHPCVFYPGYEHATPELAATAPPELARAPATTGTYSISEPVTAGPEFL